MSLSPSADPGSPTPPETPTAIKKAKRALIALLRTYMSDCDAAVWEQAADKLAAAG
jgi:hypothetical protein